MNSFFLAETLKYLFLLFDDGSNFVHRYDVFHDHCMFVGKLGSHSFYCSC